MIYNKALVWLRDIIKRHKEANWYTNEGDGKIIWYHVIHCSSGGCNWRYIDEDGNEYSWVEEEHTYDKHILILFWKKFIWKTKEVRTSPIGEVPLSFQDTLV